MNGFQLALALGGVTTAGVAGAAYALVPMQPDLKDVLERLSPGSGRPSAPAAASIATREERWGIWAQRALPARLLGLPPARDLAVLGVTPAQFYGRKVTGAAAGFCLPLVLTLAAPLLGIHLPFVIPLAATLALAVLLFVAPSRDLGAQAKAARQECARALSAYIELCALERNRGAGAWPALESAAQVGDSWLFRQIRETLARCRYNGQQPWDALTELADELGLPELEDVADIMRLAGTEDSEVYRQLRARSAAIRSALLSAELGDANVVEERMYLPASFLGFVFLALLTAPPLLRLFGMS
ncbi:membrane protein [Cellulomonas chitinilytica]|uniref:Membrane protein n=1 Tax=Cellulomonas chitinilytica TaxID=398759 RepID=A0A919TZS7_9CELL|nr:hypothetical protein [Cellulomonas chitinilytica]GIG21158.1 membrane protein [Cellulomonas chitinilytica]